MPLPRSTCGPGYETSAEYLATTYSTEHEDGCSCDSRVDGACQHAWQGRLTVFLGCRIIVLAIAS